MLYFMVAVELIRHSSLVHAMAAIVGQLDLDWIPLMR